MVKMDYPEPIYPKFRKFKNKEEILNKVRELLKQPEEAPSTSLKPNYDIKPGEKILLGSLSEYDEEVMESLVQILTEQGAKVDRVIIDSAPLSSPQEIASLEAVAIGKDEGDYNFYYTMITNLLRNTTASALVEREGYDKVISGTAGPLPPVSTKWYRFNYPYLEDIASPQTDFPFELQKMIDDKIYNLVNRTKKINIKDPEGTDISWTNYDDERPNFMNHQFLRPVNIGYNFNQMDDCEGVISGTVNHMGAFPHAKAHLKGGQVVKVEGGGVYGDIWREKLELLKDVEMPPFTKYDPRNPWDAYTSKRNIKMPEPGFFWFRECALGTSPLAFRAPREGKFQLYANFLHERRRSGYIHCGFGPSTGAVPILVKKNIPWAHLHIHLMFATITGELPSGEKYTLVDKGHLTMLDDPEVLDLASKLNATHLLKEAWIPGVPGINMDGDYYKDYANDPVKWIMNEAQEHEYWDDAA